MTEAWAGRLSGLRVGEGLRKLQRYKKKCDQYSAGGRAVININATTHLTNHTVEYARKEKFAKDAIFARKQQKKR